MSRRSETFRLNGPSVISQTNPGDAVIINLETGTYYSLTGVAAEIWGMLESSLETGRIVERLGRSYIPAAESEIEESVRSFIEEMMAEGLIVSAENDGVDILRQEPPSSPEGKIPFVKPFLQKFTDMQDLLLLDPIHEVDESGWPGRNPDSGANAGG